MRRRALLSATATALTIPLLAGCTRDGGDGGGEDDGGDGDAGGGGPYGMVGPGDARLSAHEGSEDDDRRGRPDGPALGPQSAGDD